MRYRDIMVEMVRLPLEQRLLLLEELTRSLRADLSTAAKAASSSPPKLTRGMLRLAEPPPGDAQSHNDYVNYLIQKYL
jgi:hypothetical protein